jgi:hypothetical protein
LAEEAAKRSEFPNERFEEISQSRTYAIPLAVGLIFAVAVAVRLWLSRDIVAPWIMTDELFYSELAKSFGSSGEFLIRDYPTDLRTLYSALIAPAWVSDSTGTAYAASKAINVVLMTLAAVPVYFWTRRVASRAYAVLACALTLSMPALVYTGMLMTENAFFPAFVLASYAIALSLERPTLLRQGLAFAAIGLACLVRIQGVVLLAMLPVAILVMVLLALRAEGRPLRARSFLGEVRRYAASLTVLAVLVLGYVVVQLAKGAAFAGGLGAYRITGEADYSRTEAARWFVFHLGELGYSVGIIPVCALIVCFGLAVRRKADFSVAERAFLAVTVASLLLVLQVAVYASRFAFRIEERNMFHVAPLFFVALVVWLARGLPRPAGLTAVAVAVPAALLVTIPFESLFTISLLSDSFALVPLLRLTQRLDGGAQDVRVLLGLGLVGAAVLFAALPRRWAAVLVPLSVIGFLLISSVSTFRTVRFQSVAVRGTAGPTDAAWVDHAIGTEPRAAFLYTPEIANPHTLWQTEFWNRAVGPIYQVQTDAPGNPGSAATVDLRTGRIVVPDPRGRFPPEYAVADADARIVGEVVAQDGALALTRVQPPLRVETRTEGIQGDGWMGAEAAFNHYTTPDEARPRAIRITVSRAGWAGPDKPGDVRIRVGRIDPRSGVPRLAGRPVERTWVIHSGTARTFVVPAPQPPFRAEIRIAPTFSPADYGQPDPRQLGAQVTFEALPSGS